MIGTWYIEKGKSNYNVIIDTLDRKEKSIYMKSSGDDHSYCNVLNNIPNGYKGDTLELSTLIKSENIEHGDAKIMINLLKRGRSINYALLDSYQVTGSTDWKRYSVRLYLDPATDTIVIAAGMSGLGDVWFKDFVVTLDGENIKNLPNIEKLPPRAELDREFDNSSQIRFEKLEDTTVKRLAELCKVWGKLKYTNAKVTKGEYNWDYELFRIMPIVEQEDFLEKLEEWKLSFGLETTIIPKDHYYLDFYPNVGNVIFVNEKEYKDISFKDHGFRLLSLFRIGMQ
ncbi:hypothetical protein [Myroides injenensis]|uniref:hypothetical protein n=1 Tax=Myroides injenensis TaxID=1183151 RepID=UPI0002FAB657|nr:hypothetical protein [Myroides injenensis]